MPTAVQIKNKTNADIRLKTEPRSLSNADHADINDMIVDYVDQEVAKLGVQVVLQIQRDGGTGAYTVTNVKNETGITFTAEDSGTAIVQVNASDNFFVNGKTLAILPNLRGGGNPLLCFDNGFMTQNLRFIVMYNVETQTEQRGSSFNMVVSYTVFQ